MNRTCTVAFYFDTRKELNDLQKGKTVFGVVSYTFGTWQTAAKWLKTDKTAKRLCKKASEVLWREGQDGDFIASCLFESNRPDFMAKVDEILASEEEKKKDEEYLKEWAEI